MKYMKLFVIAILFTLFACEQDGSQTDAATDDPLPDGVSYGILSVTSLPEGATVFLDGEAKGVTQTMIENLIPNSYDLLVTLEGYADHEETVTVVADNVTDIEVTLQPAVLYNLAGRWSMDGEPDICDVRQNGNEVRGFCGVPNPLILNGNQLNYGPDELEKVVNGTVADESHVQLTYTHPYGESNWSYTRL
ncbi:PEGA domain-containing protein [Patescibacteria group bacterium]|nr:PEGA domain-containing protein [Patescibacteria group bacterium]